MKTFLLLFLSAIPLLANGQTYFKDGMRWTTWVSGTHTPEGATTFKTTTIEGDTIVDGLAAMKMYSMYDSEGAGPALVAIVRTEGEKVYFQNRTGDEWHLLYDFGLETGEGCLVTSIPGKWNYPSSLRTTYVKCVGTNKNDESYDGWDTMMMEEYDSEDCGQPYGSGIWLKGLAAAMGVQECNGFDLDGRTSLLTEASYNGEVLYTRTPPSGISGTATRSLSVRTDGLTLSVSCNENPTGNISLYAFDGTLIESRKATAGNTHTFILPGKGIYLLQTGNKTQKVLAF